MESIFNEQSVWRECNQWRAVFANPSEGNSQLFANFGSINEDSVHEQDIESLVRAVSEQFALDVFTELKNDVQFEPMRSVRTSQADRKLSQKPVTPHKTPNVTPIHSRRGNRNVGNRAREKYLF